MQTDKSINLEQNERIKVKQYLKNTSDTHRTDAFNSRELSATASCSGTLPDWTPTNLRGIRLDKTEQEACASPTSLALRSRTHIYKPLHSQ